MDTIGIELLRETAQAAFWQAHEDYPALMDGISARVDSDSDQETYPWLSGAPAVREMVGGRQKRSIPEQNFTIVNKEWENTITIGYKLRRFDKLGQVAATLADLGAKARAYPDKLMSLLLDNGGTDTCYDALSFFNDAHLEPRARYQTNQDNALTSNITTPTAPTDLEFAAAVRSAIDALHGFKDGEGDPVWPGMNPNIVVMVPTNMRSVARRVMVADQLTGPVANDVQGEYSMRVNPYLANNERFYIFNAGGRRKPFIFQEADPVMLEDDAGGDDDFNTKSVSFGSFGMYNVGYGDWRYCIEHIFT